MGCSSDDSVAGAGPDPAGSMGGTSGADSGAEPTDVLPCSEDPSLIPDGAVCVHDIYGRMLDENGDAVENELLISACGPQQCNPGYTDAVGDFRVPVNLHIVPGEYSVIGHGRPERASFYFMLPSGTDGPNIDVGTLRHLSMPVDGPSLIVDREGAPAQSVTSGEVTLEIPDGIYVRLDVESNLFQEEGEKFKALRVPDELLGDFIDPSLGAVALYGFEPFESQFEVAGSGELVDIVLTFENSMGLAADSAVEVLALGSYLHPDWLTPARFEPVATATVTSDGAQIVMDEGQGVTYLTWVALRPLE